MKKVLLILILFLPRLSFAQYTTPLATAIKASTNNMTVTTATIDSSGKDICWVLVSAFGTISPGTTVVVTDSLNGVTTYTQDSIGTDATQDPFILTFSLRGLTVGAGHSFTATCVGNACYPQAMGLCSSGSASSPFDNATSAGDAGSGVNTQASGSYTPGVSNCIILSGLGYRNTTANATVSAGFTLISSAHETGDPAIGLGGAYKIVSSGCASAVNPTWTWGGGAALAVANVASYNASGGGGASGPNVGSTATAGAGK